MDTRHALLYSTPTDPGANLYQRLDSINVNAAERERVKDDLQAAETTVDAVLGLLGTLRGWLNALRSTPGRGAAH